MQIAEWLKDWALVIGAWAAFFTAVAALAAILITKKAEKRRRREKICNEILSWATDAAMTFVRYRGRLSNINKPEEYIYFLDDQLKDKTDIIDPLRTKGVYIYRISGSITPHLQRTVTEVLDSLKEHVGALNTYRLGMEKRPPKEVAEEVWDKNGGVQFFAMKLMKELSGIETEDL